jgi:uncharacterized protein (DUF1330 family)
MKSNVVKSLVLVAVFGLGHVSARWGDRVAHAQSGSGAEKAAYLIASTSPVQTPPERVAKYREVAGPLARKAGVQIVAAGAPGSTLQVLEGEWPYQGRVIIERYSSMKALMEFWNSREYQDARKLRHQANFIVAFEATQ